MVTANLGTTRIPLTDAAKDIFEDQGIFWYDKDTGNYDLEPILNTLGNNCGDVWDSFTLGKYTGTAGGGDDQTTAAGAWTELVSWPAAG